MAVAALERFRARRGSPAAETAGPDTAEFHQERRAAAQSEFRHLVGKGFSAALVRDLLDVS